MADRLERVLAIDETGRLARRGAELAIGAAPSAWRRSSPMKQFRRRVLACDGVATVGNAGCNSDQLPPAAGFADVNRRYRRRARRTRRSPERSSRSTRSLRRRPTRPGNSTIDKVPSGIADYAVQAKGYQTLASTANVEPGKPFQLNLTLAQQAVALELLLADASSGGRRSPVSPA